MRYQALPEIVTDYPLELERGWFAILQPKAGQNLFTNPSFETNTTGWTATSCTIARSTDEQRYGAYSLKVTPQAGLAATVYATATLTAGQTYTYSYHLKGQGGTQYCIYITDSTGATSLLSRCFLATGRWQRVDITYYETVTASRRLYVSRAVNDDVLTPFYVDGMQLETGELTTYLDGDQAGLVYQVPPAYLWDGTPHASTSRRSANTRAGGKEVNLRDLGFILTGIIGLGMPDPQIAALEYATLPGGIFQGERTPTSDLTLTGRILARTRQERDRWLRQIEDLVNPAAVTPGQECVLIYRPDDCEPGEADERVITAKWVGGLAGAVDNRHGANVGLQFRRFTPHVAAGGDSAVSLTSRQAITFGAGATLLQRDTDGNWTAIGDVQGGSATINDILRAGDGSTIITGNFTSVNGVYALNAARRTIAGEWQAMNGGISGTGNALAPGPDGKVYVGFNGARVGPTLSPPGAPIVISNTCGGSITPGTYTYYITAYNANGETLPSAAGSAVIAGDCVAVSWSAVAGATGYKVYGRGQPGTGLLQDVGNVLAYSDDGSATPGAALPATNTAFTTTARYVASYDLNTGAWAEVGNGFNAQVRDLAFGMDGILYGVGDFTQSGGGTTLNYTGRLTVGASTWATMVDTSTGNIGLSGAGFAVAAGFRYVYVGFNGTTTNGGGVTLNYIGQWDITEAEWLGMGSGTVGLNSLPAGLLLIPGRMLYVVGLQTQAGGASSRHLSIWDGSRWSTPGGGLTNQGSYLSIGPDGRVYVSDSGSLDIGEPSSFTIWTGSQFLPLDLDPPGSLEIPVAVVTQSNEILAYSPNTGTGYAAGVIAASNDGQAGVAPKVIIKNNGTGSANIYQIRNFTTGAEMYFNDLAILAGETLTLDFAGSRFISDFRGDISSYIISGADKSTWTLQPGNNSVSLFVNADNIAATMQWREQYASIH